jgi:hypothetical protein
MYNYILYIIYSIFLWILHDGLRLRLRTTNPGMSNSVAAFQGAKGARSFQLNPRRIVKVSYISGLNKNTYIILSLFSAPWTPRTLEHFNVDLMDHLHPFTPYNVGHSPYEPVQTRLATLRYAASGSDLLGSSGPGPGMARTLDL